MLYPSPLLSAKTLPIPENMENKKDPKLISYTKHYYIGTERIASVIGSKSGLGAYCFSADPSISLEAMEIKVDAAGAAVQNAFAHFEKTITLPSPFLFSSRRYNCSGVQVPEDYAAFWYHPDHLGSSSYITNLAGEITQHMEYLPFGETLIEEHLNSNNSPYRFNAKELDPETGNYYYGARYYDPKFSIWLSLDPLAEKYPSISPYVYVANNPIKYIDPDGRRILIYSRKGEPYEYKDGDLINTNTGKIYQGNDGFLLKNKEALIKLDNASSSFFMEDGVIKKRGMINDIVQSDDIYSIVYKERAAQAIGGRIEIDPFTSASTPLVRTTKGKQKIPYEVTLAHELGHGYSTFRGFHNGNTWFSMMDSNGEERDISYDENWAMHFENYFRSEMGLPLRTHYNELSQSKIFSPLRFVQKSVNSMKPEKPIFRSPRHF